jgi:hypothetical protein
MIAQISRIIKNAHLSVSLIAMPNCPASPRASDFACATPDKAAGANPSIILRTGKTEFQVAGKDGG